jgi:hypothetical protein
MRISLRALSGNRSLLAASLLLPIILLPGTAISGNPNSGGSGEVTCPGVPGTWVILENQPYALCAGAVSTNFNAITYANCASLNGNSISLPHPFPSAPGDPKPGDIATVNQGQPKQGGYIVSTYSAPAGAVNPNGNLAVYTCNGGGTFAQCDGGLCFTSTSTPNSKSNSPLWGDVSKSEIICSCPIVSTAVPFEVMGPKPCPTTAAEYDTVCGSNVSQANNGAAIFIGGPGNGTPGGFVTLAECLQGGGQSVTLNTCTRPAQ